MTSRSSPPVLDHLRWPRPGPRRLPPRAQPGRAAEPADGRTERIDRRAGTAARRGKCRRRNANQRDGRGRAGGRRWRGWRARRGARSPSSVDADRPLDAEQPAGGCGTASKSCVSNVLQVCEPSGNASSTMCANGCDPVRLECNRCKPNSRTCDGANQIVCNAEGSETTTMPCTSGCNGTTGECNGCQPSTTWCNGDVLRECTPAGEQRDRQTCDQGCNATSKACNTCRPSAKICNGNILETCKPDGTGTTTETCPAGCNPARQACNTCDPGSKQCAGTTLRTCKTDGSGYAEEPCPNGCTTNRCNTCNPTQGPTCEGGSLKGMHARRQRLQHDTLPPRLRLQGLLQRQHRSDGRLLRHLRQPKANPAAGSPNPAALGALRVRETGGARCPCGNGPGQRCCDGDTRPCPEPDRCGRGTQRCSNGNWGNCSQPPLECCNSDQCDGNKTCQGNRCRCPQNTNDVGGSCVPCGGGEGQPCCESSRPCRGQRLICQTGPETCTICGGVGDGCCGPQRTNSSGRFPDTPGQCFEGGAECFRSTGTSPGFSCG